MDKTAVLIKREGKFLMLKNDSEEKWSAICESIERGETFREAARRQTRKAVGVEIEFEEKVTRTEVTEEDRIHWYLAGEKSPTEEEPEPEQIDAEGDRMEWFNPEELEELELDSFSQQFLKENKNNLVEG